MSERADRASVARRMMAVHNEDPHVLLERFEEFFHPECEWVPVIVGSLEGNKYRGKRAFSAGMQSGTMRSTSARVDIESCEEVREDVVLLLGRSHAVVAPAVRESMRRSASCFAFEMG